VVEISICPVPAILAYSGRTLGDDLALLFAPATLIGEREMAAALDPFADFGIVLLKLLINHESCDHICRSRNS